MIKGDLGYYLRMKNNCNNENLTGDGRRKTEDGRW
ncbi:MAG: hypothetical protein ACJATF_001430, partial [Flavobacteriales bacterium]